MGHGIASVSRAMVAILLAISIPLFVQSMPAEAGAVSVQVAAVTQTVANVAASQTPATAGCPTGTVLVGGGIRVFFAAGDQIVTSSVYEPNNGLVVKGSLPTDASGTIVPTADPANWTAFGGFAGQSEAGDDVTSFALCSTGGPGHTQVVTATVNAPTAGATVARVTASCPAGTRLVGGGGQTAPASSASLKLLGTYPSNASGSTTTVTDPDSWSAVGGAGGAANTANTTTAFAVCSTDATLHTQVARADVIDHPAGAGNSNPGQDPVATATATCPAGTTLLDGGALTDGNAPGPDGGTPQQGVHVRGSYPSDIAGTAVADGAPAPTSWSSIVQSGGQATPGTDTHAFALCAQGPTAGSVLATGYNGYGQLCNATTTGASTATGATSPLDAGVVAVSAGTVHTMALTSAGTIYTCGRNNFGQLGNGTTTDSSTPVAVPVPGTVTQIAAGWAFNLALTSTGTVYAWGFNGDGELGTTSSDSCSILHPCARAPVAVSLGGATVKAIAAGWDHSLAIASDDTVLAWGMNNFGQLGTGDTTNRPVPVPALGGITVAAIACGGIHSLAIRKSDSTGLAWGRNNDGQLGVGTTDAFLPNPTPLASSAALTAIAAGSFHSLAIRSGGAPLAWGDNASGQLGDGTTTNRLSPVPPLAPADSTVTGLAAGWAHSLFVR